MPIFSRFRRPFRRPQRGAWSALLALSLGWTLALAHAAELSPRQVELASHDSTRIRIDAELRVGEPAPVPVADVAEAPASLRALNTRARYAPNQHPLAWNKSTNAAWLALALVLPLPLRLRAQALSTSGTGAESAPKRAIARRWPLPRSSCSDSDPDADAARRS